MNKLYTLQEKVLEITEIVKNLNELSQEYNKIENPNINDVIKYTYCSITEITRAYLIALQDGIPVDNGGIISIQHGEHK